VIEFFAERPIWNDSLELYAKEQYDGQVFALVCNGIEKKERNLHTPWPRFFEQTSLSSEAGQSLFDALWKCGYRPNKGESSLAHVDALKYHLEDMRKLVFK
jgi:hypothetical protein